MVNLWSFLECNTSSHREFFLLGTFNSKHHVGKIWLNFVKCRNILIIWQIQFLHMTIGINGVPWCVIEEEISTIQHWIPDRWNLTPKKGLILSHFESESRSFQKNKSHFKKNDNLPFLNKWPYLFSLFFQDKQIFSLFEWDFTPRDLENHKREFTSVLVYVYLISLLESHMWPTKELHTLNTLVYQNV